MNEKSSLESKRFIHPGWMILFFIVLFMAVWTLHLPEKITAILGLGAFFLLTFLNPVSGLIFTVITIPFFLGAPHKPYFSLYEIPVYGILVWGFFNQWKEKRSLIIPLKPLVLLFILAALGSIPVNAKEYFWTLWATPPKEIWFQWLRGHEKFPLTHLRALSNLLSGIALFILSANLFSKVPFTEWKKIAKGLIGMAILICGIGILFLYQIFPSHSETYLSLSLTGTQEGGLTAFAFNRQYLAQYLLILFPWVFFLFITNRMKISGLVFYGLVMGLFLFCLSASMQRSAFLVLFVEILLLLGFFSLFIAKNKRKSAYFFLTPFFIFAAMILVDFLFLDKRFITRFLLIGFSEPDQRRLHLWNTAWNMFLYSPLLGMGLGKYFEFFPEFFKDPILGWKTFAFFRGEPHSFYFQTLAEQGILGLLLILALFTFVIVRLLKKARQEGSPEQKMLLGALAVSLITWMSLGFFHNVAYVRSLGIFFWVLLGWSAGLTFPKEISNNRLWKSIGWYLGLTVLLMAMGYQIKLITYRPVSPFFQTGLYSEEVLSTGEKIRWTGKKAIFPVDLYEGKKELMVSTPLPGIGSHPQTVQIWVGEKLTETTLKDSGWHRISISTEKPITQPVLLRIETSYTFNPRKAGISTDNRDLGIMIREN